MPSVTISISKPATPPPDFDHDRHYPAFLEKVREQFASVVSDPNVKLFTTDVGDIFPAYLASLPAELRQQHNCRACASFLNRYGGLATITSSGALVPALWGTYGLITPGDSVYPNVTHNLARLVVAAEISGIFRAEGDILGTPATGPWNHIAVRVPDPLVHKALLLTVEQAVAAKAEDYRNVTRAVGVYQLDTLDQALALLNAYVLNRSEKFIAPIQWLRDLIAKLAAVKGRVRRNLIWAAVAAAPDGFCHPRSAVTGTLLEDLAQGLPLDVVKRRWAEKLHPLQYQRPQADPAAGNIARAEEIVEKLGILQSLKRRWAAERECVAIWRPIPVTEGPKRGGEKTAKLAFSHLQNKTAKTLRGAVPEAVVMTWEKFVTNVMPLATQIELTVPAGLAPFGALTTATYPDAPPILAWDRPERRNPVAWYLYNPGSLFYQWNLHGGETVRVLAICQQPNLWFGPPPHVTPYGDGALLILKGAADARNCGLALFPETMRRELHEVRATIEAHSRSGKLTSPPASLGRDMAAGLMIQRGSTFAPFNIRVTLGTQNQLPGINYTIDRWD